MHKWIQMSELDRELAYNPKKAVIDHEKFQNLATNNALNFREKTKNKFLEISYGKGIKQKLDIFVPNNPSNCPVQVYFHGGYWVSRDKFDHSHLAKPSLKNKIIHVSVNYDLCPDVSLSRIVEETTEAIEWIFHNIDLYGGDKNNLNLVGHSAGAHLIAMSLTRNFTIKNSFIHSAALISGIFQPEITMYLSVNKKIRLTDNLAQITNVFNYKLATKTKFFVIVGEYEPKEWRELSIEYISWLKRNNVETKLYIAKGLNHFTIVKSLSDPKSILSNKLINLIK